MSADDNQVFDLYLITVVPPTLDFEVHRYYLNGTVDEFEIPGFIVEPAADVDGTWAYTLSLKNGDSIPTFIDFEIMDDGT